MKKILALALGLRLFASSAFAADSTVSAMTAASTLGGTELTYCVQGGADRKCTMNQIAAWANTFPLVAAGTTTSGGIPYFSSATALSSSGLLAANALMIGGGAGAAPSTTTTGTGVLTALGIATETTGSFTRQNGAITAGNCLKWSASGIQDAGAACGTGGGGSPGGSSGQIQYNNASSFGGSLLWQGTNTIEQYNSTTAQSAYIYNTRTDASNYERGVAGWTTNVFRIGTEKAGTGSDRNLEIVIGGTRKADYGITNANQWTFAAVANVAGSVVVQQTSGYYTTGWGGFRFMSDGVVQFTNTAGTGFGRVQFGGTTVSFPALRRNNAVLEVRLADDSAFAPLSAELVTVAAGTATPAGGSTAARLLMGTTAGFGIYYGSGAPTVSAAQGSIYLRSDGSSTSTRMYVNTDGATTWTNVTTGG